MANQAIFVLCALCFTHTGIIRALQEPEVSLSTGKVRGQQLVSAVNKLYYSFRGIPYAAPPIGFLRFKAPQPPDSWNGTLNAFHIPPACSQPWRKLQYPERYSEDCLYINVYTPYLKPPGGVLMPVMVWIHGGKHYQGSSTSFKYGADFLVTEDVVVVSFNYRLGVFGYLNMNARSAQGNVAGKDKVAALRWVQKEIGHFGGDPSSVTIFGGSSGAQDVECLYISPLAQGLFHGAISQSGLNCDTSDRVDSLKLGFRLAKMLGCPSSDAEAAVKCLKGITSQVLAEIQMEVTTPEPGQSENPFGLTVEKDFGEEPFFAVSTEELLTKSKSEVPYIIGINSGEGMMYVDLPNEYPSQFSDFERDFKFYLPSYIRENSSKEVMKNITKKLKQFYFNGKAITFESVNGYMQFMMDSRFTYPILLEARSISKHAPVYLYYFAFEGKFKIRQPNDVLNLSGVNHGNELGYLFYRNIVIPEQNHMFDYPTECEILTKMVKLWTNFAKYRNPTPHKKDSLLEVKWLPMNSTLTQHLVINRSLYMETRALLPERVDVWDIIYNWVETDEDALSVGLTIIACVFALAAISLVYLLYSCLCRNGYIQLGDN